MGGARGGVEDVKNPMFKTNWLTLHLKFFPQTNRATLEITQKMSVNKHGEQDSFGK